MKFQGHHLHVVAVREMMKEEVDSGRIRTTATTVSFPVDADALPMLETALDREHPGWRSNPLEHLHNFTRPRQQYLYLLQVRANICKQQDIDPRKV